MFDRFRCQALLLASLVLLPLSALAQADTFFLSVVDEERGQTFVHTDRDSEFRVSGSRERIFIYTAPIAVDPPPAAPRYDDFTIDVHAPAGQVLGPGLYPDLDCPNATSGRALGFEAYENNRPCAAADEIYGWVTIRQIEFDANGALTRLELAFSQRVDSPTAPALNGVVRYNTQPLSLRFVSPRRSLLGAIDEVFMGDTSLFDLTDNGAGGLLYTASALRAQLQLSIDTAGQALQVGRYATDSNTGPVRMSLMEGEAPPDVTVCQGPGVLDVQEIARDGTGRIVGLRATFQQYCGDRPARPASVRTTSVYGEIRYNL